MMKNKGRITSSKRTIMITLGIMAFAVLAGCGKNEARKAENPGLKITPESAVRIVDILSDTEESSYGIEADLHGTDYSVVSRKLADAVSEEWEKHDGMTDMQRMFSSHAFGFIKFEADTWKECEEITGFAIDNPLENIERLVKASYYGMDFSDLKTPVKHVSIDVNAASPDRQLNSISATAGYVSGKARITLTVTTVVEDKTYSTGKAEQGYAEYEQKVVSTGSGISAIVVNTNASNNKEYYTGLFYDADVYWVKGNALYNLRVWGDKSDEKELKSILDGILADI